jgi:hypothetical protein
MKHLKILGLAAVAAAALMAFVGASTASADVLCTTNNTPVCAKGWVITELHATLKTGTKAVLESGGTSLIECSESTVKGTVEHQSHTVEPEGPITALTWGTCNHTADTIKTGRLKVETFEPEPGKIVHTVTATESEVTTFILGLTCTYGPGAGPISLGDLTQGAPAVIDVSTTVNKTAGGGLCPGTARWTATYQITNHTGVWISTKEEGEA